MRDYLDTYARQLDAGRTVDPETNLSGYEIRVLWMMDGGPKLDWGAAMSVSCEHLAGRGLCTYGPNFQITDAGRQALAATKSKDNADG